MSLPSVPRPAHRTASRADQGKNSPNGQPAKKVEAKDLKPSAPIAENRRARYDYHIEERYEAGMVLTGWEIKAIRAGQVQLTDGYVVIKGGELFLIGCRINALRSASTHVNPEADRTKKLLMHASEIRRLIGKVEQRGFTLVPLNLHYKGGRVKAEIALAKGKAEHDKRNTEKDRDWQREKGQLMRQRISG
jgi:SsrA-binding protein